MALSAESVGNPFSAGRPVWVIQGYEGYTHQGCSRYAVDLALVGTDSSDAEVESPVEGSVTWAQEPGGTNGCEARPSGASRGLAPWGPPIQWAITERRTFTWSFTAVAHRTIPFRSACPMVCRWRVWTCLLPESMPFERG